MEEFPTEAESEPQPVAAERPVRRSILSALKRKSKPAPALEPQLVEFEIEDAPVDEPQPAAAPVEARPAPMPAPKATPIGDIAMALQHLGQAGRRVTLVGAARNAGTTHSALTLARALAAKGNRVVLCDLALNAPNISVLSTDPQAPGFAELTRGTASFADIVTRDKYSSVHLIATGKATGDAPTIMSSPRLVITLEALARTYDNVVIDAGAIGDAALHPLARMAPRAILVAVDLADPATAAARQQLIVAGFADVTLIQGAPATGEAAYAAA
jgi:Mrp family chromosome partitioning ATPase